MRFSFQAISVVLLSVIFVAVPAGAGNDLVIKKKDGTLLRIPLKFDPEQIESFDMEAAPEAVSPPAEAPTTAVPAQPPAGTREQPEEVSPPAGLPRVGPRQPGPAVLPGPGIPLPPLGRQEAAPKQQITAVSQQPSTKTRQQLTVNVYKLKPVNSIRSLPDYGALKPVETIQTQQINLDGASGAYEPADIPQDTEGLGMRFQGTFFVSGEGLFRWRIYCKDSARMHIDDKTILENDGIHGPSSKTGFIHLAEGAHTIIVDSFNSKGPPVLQLFVSPPTGEEQLFSSATTLAGWKEPEKPYDVLWGQIYIVPKGEYPKGPDLSKLTPVGRLIAPELNLTGTSDIPGLPEKKDNIAIRYEGFFNVEGAGIFAFRLASDYYAKLTIGKFTIVETTGKDADGAVGWAFLEKKGSYPITIEYYHPSGPPRLELYVAQPKTPESLFSPHRLLTGYPMEKGSMPQIPGFAYFLKPGTTILPNLNKIKAAGMFFTSSIDYGLDRPEGAEFPGVPKRDSWLGLRFVVNFGLESNEKGNYKFRVVSKSGARLIVDKKIVVNEEHPTGEVQDKSGTVVLGAGQHTIFLDYFTTTGPNALQLFITSPNAEEKVFAFQ